MRLLRQLVYDLKKQNTDIGLKLVNVSETLEHKLVEFDKKIAERDNEILLLKNSVSELQHRLNFSEQENMRSELEIFGVPEENNENVSHVVMLTARKIGVQLVDSEIDEAFRAGARRSNAVERPRSIILRLTRRSKRSDILKAAKNRRPLTSEDIVKGTSSKVFINERLTKTNKELFRNARIRAQAHGFRFCWIRNGTIYVRKAEKQPPIPIRSSADLDDNVGPPGAPASDTVTA
ncbi:uncharacterized protein LOC142985797 [Anticarsia gemmatalis]|uniref:uncharacterized protein LOC142985797 n=1 Tax=Anticarsia gemmatalis TaxID=129554 RepID=UPI003F75F6A7